MQILNKAIIFAVNAHSGTVRKGTDIPYITHPLESCSIAASITNDKEIIAAAVLHDVVEDTSCTKEDLVNEFGERVAYLVMSDTENKMRDIPAEKSWRLRKQATLDFLENATKAEQIICLSDKLSNLRAIHRDYKLIGDKLWKRFNNSCIVDQAWYYGGIAERLTFLKDTQPYIEYLELCKRVFG